MAKRRSDRWIKCLILGTALVLVPASAARADNVVADDQIVQGNLCAGLYCVNGESFGPTPLLLKTGNTPAIRFGQTSDGGFDPYSWDIGANEANFFIRDVNGGSRLPFRIRPGARTSSIDIQATSEVRTVGAVSQSVDPAGLATTGAADESAILASLRTLPISRYTINVDSDSAPHIGPAGAAFRAAFNIGASDNYLAPSDQAGVALAAVKALDARISNLPAGAQGPQGPAADLTSANKRIAALERSNKSLSSSLKKLRKQVRGLSSKRH